MLIDVAFLILMSVKNRINHIENHACVVPKKRMQKNTKTSLWHGIA